ncbi:PQQ-binding-like beta-propeller repeat protein [bacterium]|nr:PQQ-binding-like beta-propeller repeat protein [bacterium]
MSMTIKRASTWASTWALHLAGAAIVLCAAACSSGAAPTPPTAPTPAAPTSQAASPAPAQLVRGDDLYKLHCASCHEPGLAGAPQRSALAMLTPARIHESLTTGVMRTQAAMLSGEERILVARFLSQVQPASDVSGRGWCEASKPGDAAPRGPVVVADWGMDLQNSRRVKPEATTLRASNAGSLALDWVFAFPESTRARVQPTVAGDALFTADQNGVIYALDLASGCIRWTHEAGIEIRSPLIIGADAEGRASHLYFGDFGGNVHALDLKSGRELWSVRADPHPQTTITGAMRLFEGRLYVPVSSLEVVSAIEKTYECCTFRGAVLALDAATGRTIWKTYTVDEAVQQGTNSAGARMMGPSGAPVWSSPTIDAKRRLVYVGTGENYSRPASDMSDSIIAMSLDDGTIKWVFQALGDDVWNAACPGGANCPVSTGPDYDFGAAPVLARTRAGRELVLAGQKSGWVYALDPDAGGREVWRRKVGRGGIMGGVHWGMMTDGDTLFVPISDLSVYPKDAHLPAQSGVHAVRVADGEPLWSTVLPDTCGKVAWRCHPGVSAAATLAGDVILGGSLDGKARAFSAADGRVLWTFDTNRTFDAVNGISGEGGSIDSSGPVVVGGRVFLTSGYDKFGQKPGNLLFAFSVR